MFFQLFVLGLNVLIMQYIALLIDRQIILLVTCIYLGLDY